MLPVYNGADALNSKIKRKRNFISITDATGHVEKLIESALMLKRNSSKGRSRPLNGKQIALIFEKHSTRTRVSFEVACDQLGCNAIYLSSGEMQLGRGETIEDTARVLSRYVDCIVYRAYENKNMVALAEHSAVPVINALDNLEHPCQALADLMTIRERFGRFRGLKLTYVGDGNNVCNSLMLGSALVGMNFTAACPRGYEPPQQVSQQAASISIESKCRIELTDDPAAAVRGADIVYTDVWVSMGQEKEEKDRIARFSRYQVNSELLSLAKKNAIVMHCLPAHRGLEITDEVLEGKSSVVFDQAENRLHTEKALLLWILR